MLKILLQNQAHLSRMSSGVLHFLISSATFLHISSSKFLMSRKLAARIVWKMMSSGCSWNSLSNALINCHAVKRGQCWPWRRNRDLGTQATHGPKQSK
jgi:hypothetical protein